MFMDISNDAAEAPHEIVDARVLQKAARATRFIFLMSGFAMASWAPMVPYAKARLHLDDADLGLVRRSAGWPVATATAA